MQRRNQRHTAVIDPQIAQAGLRAANRLVAHNHPTKAHRVGIRCVVAGWDQLRGGLKLPQIGIGEINIVNRGFQLPQSGIAEIGGGQIHQIIAAKIAIDRPRSPQRAAAGEPNRQQGHPIALVQILRRAGGCGQMIGIGTGENLRAVGAISGLVDIAPALAKKAVHRIRRAKCIGLRQRIWRPSWQQSDNITKIQRLCRSLHRRQRGQAITGKKPVAIGAVIGGRKQACKTVDHRSAIVVCRQRRGIDPRICHKIRGIVGTYGNPRPCADLCCRGQKTLDPRRGACGRPVRSQDSCDRKAVGIHARQARAVLRDIRDSGVDRRGLLGQHPQRRDGCNVAGKHAGLDIKT